MYFNNIEESILYRLKALKQISIGDIIPICMIFYKNHNVFSTLTLKLEHRNHMHQACYIHN